MKVKQSKAGGLGFFRTLEEFSFKLKTPNERDQISTIIHKYVCRVNLLDDRYRALLLNDSSVSNTGYKRQYSMDILYGEVPYANQDKHIRIAHITASMKAEWRESDEIFNNDDSSRDTWSDTQYRYFIRWAAEVICADSFFRFWA